jgi:predicted GH43/DUF377 family glycosyl hydrolase
MGWVRGGAVFAPPSEGDPDLARATSPWVLEGDGGDLRMWYSGSDGTTSRILEAVQRRDGSWERVGLPIDAGFSGESDGYGVESPCVAKTPGGYLMAYAGFDGDVARLHMATSLDGTRWVAHGPIMQRGPEDAAGASHPCVVVTGERWWLFFSGYDGSKDNRRAAILVAISQSGASWDRVGIVLEPDDGEIAASHPCVLDISGTFRMFYASDDGQRVQVALATSTDGLTWDRRGTVLAASGEGPDGLAVHAPCVVRLHDGSLRMWYAGLAVGDVDLAYRICTARFVSA